MKGSEERVLQSRRDQSGSQGSHPAPLYLSEAFLARTNTRPNLQDTELRKEMISTNGFPQLPGRILLCAVVLVIAYQPWAVSSANVADHGRAITVRASTTLTINLRDFGALGDGVADDGPALQAALDHLAVAGGGTLYIPPGSYAIATPVAKDFSGLNASIVIQGEPSNIPIDVRGNGTGLGLTSELIVKVGETKDALFFKGLENLIIEDLMFLGVQTVLNDALIVLRIHDVTSALIHHCEFYGLASLKAGGGIVLGVRSALRISETAFLGCAANSGVSTSIVQNIEWNGIAVVNSKFVDYGIRGDFYSKTPLAPPYSWISIGNAAALTPASSRREAIVENVFLDEGAYIQLSARPAFFGPSALFEVFISRLRMNVNNLRSAGVYFDGVPKAIIERSFFGWSHNASAGISMIRSGEIVLDQVECVAHANTIMADDSVQLTVINSIYDFLFSNPDTTTVLVTNDPMDDPVQFVRQQYLDTLSREPDAAAYHYWTGLLLDCSVDCADVRQDLATFLSKQPVKKFELTGTVTDEFGAPISGAIIQLTGSQAATAVSDSQGNFTFSDLATAGSYRVMASKAHYDFQSSSSLIEVSGDQSVNFSGIRLRYVISGQVRTASNQPINQARVVLSGDRSQEIITDGSGNYLFSGLFGGETYTLTVSQLNYQFSAPVVTFNDLSSDKIQDFIGSLVQYAVRGKVSLAQGGPQAGVLVAASGTVSVTTKTDAQGNYNLMLPRGDYTFTPQKAGYVFSPSSQLVNNLSADGVIDFTSSASGEVRFFTANYVVDESALLAKITVVRSENTTNSLNLVYETADGTAEQDSDYTFASGVLTFEPSETSKTFEVLITDNAYTEPDEFFELILRDDEGNLVTTATVTIPANDPTPPQDNPISDPLTFVVQQYADFLGRPPDQPGLDYWRSQIADCGNDEICKNSRRVGVSAAFFVESEFQETGGYVYRLRHAVTGVVPTYLEFMYQRGHLMSFEDLDEGKHAIATSLASSSEFLSLFPENLEKSVFIDALLSRVLQNTGVNLDSERSALQADYTAKNDRARIINFIADNNLVRQAEYNRAFVLMQYFGYLRRDPDLPGYQFWLNVLNNREPQNFRGMVCAFLTSREFQERFSPVVPQDDQACALIQR